MTENRKNFYLTLTVSVYKAGCCDFVFSSESNFLLQIECVILVALHNEMGGGEGGHQMHLWCVVQVGEGGVQNNVNLSYIINVQSL